MNQEVNKSLQGLLKSQVLWHLFNSRTSQCQINLQIRSQQIYGEKQCPSCYRVICCSRRKKVKQIWQLFCCCHVPKNLSIILLRVLGKCKGYLPKRENIKNPGARKNEMLHRWLWDRMVPILVSYFVKNSINPYVYADAIRDLLIHGCVKFRNVMIMDPVNCGKSFMLKLVEIIHHAFSNPANDKYAWVGADNAEVIVLYNFRWSSKLICWKDLLLLLEDKPVKLPSPKNQFPTDVCIKIGIPIFATSKAKIEFVGSMT